MRSILDFSINNVQLFIYIIYADANSGKHRKSFGYGSGMDCVRMLYPVLPRKKKKKKLESANLIFRFWCIKSWDKNTEKTKFQLVQLINPYCWIKYLKFELYLNYKLRVVMCMCLCTRPHGSTKDLFRYRLFYWN